MNGCKAILLGRGGRLYLYVANVCDCVTRSHLRGQIFELLDRLRDISPSAMERAAAWEKLKLRQP
jgi:hypothetical protein